MTFIFPLLLGGLALLAIPVLLHLIMRQKPRHILFPAFRFLLKRHRTNQRKLQLRHLLLLAFRLLLLALMCLALARPRIFSDRINLGGHQPVAAVLVFDTSPSMDYTLGGKSRLDLARQRALDLLEELPEGSKVALLDTAEPGGEWQSNLSLVRSRIAELRTRPANGPVSARLNEAYRLLADLDRESDEREEALPKFLYVFSDRAQNSWDSGRDRDLQSLRERIASPVHAAWIDVGVEQPVDVALTQVKVARKGLGERVQLLVTIQATGADCDGEVICRIDGEKAAERKVAKLAAGQSQVLTFERDGLAPGLHQAEISLAAADALAFNNALYATFEVVSGRRFLVLVDELGDEFFLNQAFEVTKAFRGDVRTLASSRDAAPSEWSENYRAICLLNVAAPDEELWKKLHAYVRAGGGLAVMPGGEGLSRSAYNNNVQAQQLLPGRLIKVIQSKAETGVPWREVTYRHPVLAPFRDWKLSDNVDFNTFPPSAFRYWEVAPTGGSEAHVIVNYDDPEKRPALLERLFDPKLGIRGKVLLFTTALDNRHLRGRGKWNDYLQTSFYLVLLHKTMGYLAGDAEEVQYGFVSGQTVTLSLPATQRSPAFTLQGPGLSTSETVVTRSDEQPVLTLTQPVTPGNFSLMSTDGRPIAGFSINPPPEESLLVPVPAEQIEALLGPGAVLAAGKNLNLREILHSRWHQPLELYGWLLITILFLLAAENLLANKFYRTRKDDLGVSPAGTSS